MLASAFNFILDKASFTATWERPGEVATYDIKVALSNVSRDLSGPEEVTYKGREFVVSVKDSSLHAFYPFKRGDRIITSSYGENVITYITEMRGMNGEVLGFRLRTN